MIRPLCYSNAVFNLMYFHTIARMRRHNNDHRVILDADYCINIL